MKYYLIFFFSPSSTSHPFASAYPFHGLVLYFRIFSHFLSSRPSYLFFVDGAQRDFFAPSKQRQIFMLTKKMSLLIYAIQRHAEAYQMPF